MTTCAADDQSTYTMGCYGNPDVKTPNMDQLAADGMAFDNHYVTTAICMASRATVKTGTGVCRDGRSGGSWRLSRCVTGPLVQGESVADWREDTFCEHLLKRYNNWHGVRGKRYKYAVMR